MASATILIVDDEPAVVDGIVRSLRRPEYELLGVTSSQAALELLRSRRVDVVLCDHLMPGMTGLELMGIVRDRYPDTVRIMLTGHADLQTAVKAINQGEIYRFLSKPCPSEELQVTVHLGLERLLALIRTQPELAAMLEEVGPGSRR